MLMPLRRWLRALARDKRCKTRSTKPLSANLNITTTRREAPTVRSLLREREKENLPVGRLPLVRNNLTEPRSRALEPPLPRRGTSRRWPKGRRRARSLRPVKGASVLYMRVYRSRSRLPGWLVPLDRRSSRDSVSSSYLHPRRKMHFCSIAIRSLP